MLNEEEFEQEVPLKDDILYEENINIGFEAEKPMQGKGDILFDYEEDGTRSFQLLCIHG